MRRRRRETLAVLLGVLLVAAPPLGGVVRAAPRAASSPGTAPAGAMDEGRAIIERVDWEASATGGRIVVAVRGRVQYTTHTASADPGAGLPPRAYVNLRPAKLGARLARAPIPVEDALLRRIRVGQFDPETVRIVVDLAEPALFEVATVDRPSRLLLSVRSQGSVVASATPAAGTAAPEAGAPPPAASAASAGVTTAHEEKSSAVPPVASPPEVVEMARATPPHESAKAAPPIALPSPRSAAGAGTSNAKDAREPLLQVAAAPTPFGEPTAPRPTTASMPAATPAATIAAPIPTPSASASGARGAAAAPPTIASARGHGGGRSAPRVVVLDPGHGGKDPGARGVTGDEEKVLTLAVAELVAERLRPDERLRVVLTRTDDRTVSLEQRTAIANAQGADLFVSIHANASENPELAGIETYTLNNTDDRATIRLAAMENGLTLAGASPGERDLAYILSDLLQTGKEDESVALAESVHRETVRYLRGRWKGVESLGVKKGPFYVLVGAYMPCVLVEVGFLTHETEGQRVASRRYQRDVADGIANGIRRFLDSAPANANL